jgi:phosphoribosyl-AMP cyclohydrolase
MTGERLFALRGSREDIESGSTFQPKFDSNGLIPAIATDAATGEILMFAWMNAEALALTISSRTVHFYSRSRKGLWKKGEESGNVLAVLEIRTDCDQDVVALSVRVGGDGVACHTGSRSCFYRAIDLGSEAGTAENEHPHLTRVDQPVVK